MRNLLTRLFDLPPHLTVGVFMLFEALVFLLVLPGLESTLAPYYGIRFTDNYDILGWNLAQGHGYRFLPDTSLTMMREPGYPLFLAGLFSLFGRSIAAARIANLIFVYLSALIVARLARDITGSKAASHIAPLLMAVHPGLVLAEARGGVECLFLVLLLSFFLLLYRALGSGRLAHYALAGLVLGVSANVRSTALLFPSFLIFHFFFFAKPRPPIATMILRLGVMMICAFAMLTPWIVRNYQLVGKIVPTASVAGVSAYAGYYICTHLTFQNTLFEVDDAAGDERAQVAREFGLKYKPMDNVYYLYFYDPGDELRLSSVLGERAMERYKASPMLLPTCVAKNFFHFWFSGKNWVVTWINVAIQLPYLILAGIGMVIGLRGPRRALFVPIGLFVVYTLGVYLPILAQARYSLHLVPLLCTLAAVPLARWIFRTPAGSAAP